MSALFVLTAIRERDIPTGERVRDRLEEPGAALDDELMHRLLHEKPALFIISAVDRGDS